MDSVDWLLIVALVAIAGVGALGVVAFVAGLRAGRRADLLDAERARYRAVPDDGGGMA